MQVWLGCPTTRFVDCPKHLMLWVNNDATKIGYEASFTRHVYKPLLPTGVTR